jgi:hypothetical protein
MLALYHTGRLGDEMFRYPQRPGAILYFTPDTGADAHGFFQQSRLFLELGQVNMAQKCACEAFACNGDLPAILRHLAMIHIVKDQPETAKIYLRALCRKPLHRAAATRMLRRLDEDPRLEKDPRVSEMRRAMAGRGSLSSDSETKEFSMVHLDKNPRSRMGFEFLMADYLCAAQHEKVVAEIPKLASFGYGEIPRHFQEAIVVCWRRSGKRPATAGYALDPEIMAREATFFEIQARAASPQEALHRSISAGLGGTYFFFLTFGVSGL